MDRVAGASKGRDGMVTAVAAAAAAVVDIAIGCLAGMAGWLTGCCC